MPLPSNVETVILHGRYVELDGDPCFPGYVLFNSNVRLRNPNADVIIVPVSIRVDLDSNGEFTVTLPTTNDPDNIPEDWTYTVQENLPNFSRTYGLKLPISLADPPAIVELADLSPTVGDDPSSPELTEIAWTQVSGKPATFPPSVHNHPIAEVINLQATLDGKSGVTHNHDSAYSAASHNHNAQYSGLVHSHSKSDVANLETDLAGKAELDHAHEIVQALAPTQPATIFRGFDGTQSEPVVSIQSHDGFAMADFDYGSVTFNVPINVPYFTVSNSFIIDGAGRRLYWSDTDPDLGPLGIAPDGSLWIDGPNMLLKKKVLGVWQAQPVPVHTHAASDISSGTIAIARLPVGTTASDVAAGNHTHSTGAHIHDAGEITTGTVDFARLPSGSGASQVAVGNHNHDTVYEPKKISFSLNAHQTIISSSATNVTQAVLAIPSTGIWRFRLVLFTRNATTAAGGYSYSFSAPATTGSPDTVINYLKMGSTIVGATATAWTTATAVTTANTAVYYGTVIEAQSQFTATGNVQLRLQGPNGTDNIEIRNGSYGYAEKVA